MSPAQADPGTDAGAGPDRRGYRTALVLLALAAALLLLGYGQVWASAVVAQEGLPSLSVQLAGREVQPAGSAAAVLALAGIAGLVATRRTGRAVTGVLLVLEGLLAAGGALAFGLGLGGRASTEALVSDKAGLDVAADLTITLWWVPVVAGGALLVLVGGLAVARSGRWPTMGRRYEAAGTSGQPAPGPGGAASSADAWDLLDEGVDPTLDPQDDVDARDGAQGRGAGMMSRTDAPEDTP